MKVFILLSMIFCHIIADFNLQGILAKFKQKKYWERKFPNRADNGLNAFAALLLHSFCWTFVMMIPVFVFNIGLHCYIDNEKANGNGRKVTFWSDQLMHIIYQVIPTCILLVFCVNR